MKRYALIPTLLLLGFTFAWAQSGKDEPRYTNESFARLSSIDGGVYIQRSSEEGFEDGIINMPIEEGNRLGTTDGRAELYLGRGAHLRMDNDTKVEIISLPKKDSNLTRLQVLKGNIYLSIRRLDEEKDIEVHTPDASFYILSEGLYRIDVRENRKTDIFVFYGVAEAAGEEGSVLIKSELNLSIASGRFSGHPERFLAVAEDAFDRWSESRDSTLAIQVASKRLPAELEDFEGELNENGDWNWINPYGWVWAPGGLGPYWRPYYNGSWTWLSLGGWTWLPYDPWGWVTFHYGRWGWNMGLGWYWIPGTVWGPAWVSWYWGADYWAWAPLGYWNYPLAIVDNWYYPNWNRPYYPYNSRALTVVHKDQLRAKDITKAALQGDSLKGLDNKITMTVRGSALKPEGDRMTSGGLPAGKSGIQKSGGAPVATSDRTIKAPAAKTLQPATPPTARTADKGSSSSGPTSERQIRPQGSSKTPESGRPSGTKVGSEVRKHSFGYPSSPDISIKKYSGDRSSRSIRSQFYRALQKSGSTSKSSSKGSTVSRGSSSSRSSGSKGSVSSGSRGSSSGSRSSGSRPSGGVRKK